MPMTATFRSSAEMRASGVETQFVTFGLDQEVLAAPVAQVREILDYRPPSKILGCPPHLLGLIDVRGQGVPTLDLRLRLGLERTEPTANTRILVLDVQLDDRILTLGLVADRVFEVATFSSNEIHPPPDVGVRWRSEYIAGVVYRREGFVVLMDIGRLLSSDEDAGLHAAADVVCAAKEQV
jgi:purine-binding chemotaxis protein CheW